MGRPLERLAVGVREPYVKRSRSERSRRRMSRYRVIHRRVEDEEVEYIGDDKLQQTGHEEEQLIEEMDIDVEVYRKIAGEKLRLFQGAAGTQSADFAEEVSKFVMPIGARGAEELEQRRKPPKNKRKWRRRTEDKPTAEEMEGETQEGGAGDVVENPSMEAIHAVNKSWGAQEIPRPLETFSENIQKSRTLGRLWQKCPATHGILSIAETTTTSARDFQ